MAVFNVTPYLAYKTIKLVVHLRTPHQSHISFYLHPWLLPPLAQPAKRHLQIVIHPKIICQCRARVHTSLDHRLSLAVRHR